MSEFKPLDAQRAIRDDKALRGADKAFLWAAVLRTDNGTRKVRASLAMLAKDAGFHANTATNVFAETNEPVLRYFEKVDRQPRRIDLWFHPSTRLTAGVSRDDAGTDAALTAGVSRKDPFEIARAMHSQSVGVGLTSGVSRTHSECEPSASLCPTSATASPTFFRPSSLQGDEQALDTETPSGPLTEEPASDEGLAAEEEVVMKMCELHTSFPARDCHYCNQPKRQSNAPAWKQKQRHEDTQQQNEAPGIDGYPVEGHEIARLSDVRKQRRSA
jgi:hypothetical protein